MLFLPITSNMKIGIFKWVLQESGIKTTDISGVLFEFGMAHRLRTSLIWQVWKKCWPIVSDRVLIASFAYILSAAVYHSDRQFADAAFHQFAIWSESRSVDTWL